MFFLDKFSYDIFVWFGRMSSIFPQCCIWLKDNLTLSSLDELS